MIHKYLTILKMKKYLSTILLVAWCYTAFAQSTPVTKVACIGNSITAGARIQIPERDSYPAILSQLLGSNYEVQNYGLNGRTMLQKGDYPYMQEKLFTEALHYNPDIVVIKLGTNDSKSHNWKHHKEFYKDMTAMVDAFLKLPSKPRIYLCYPAKAYLTGKQINDSIITNGIMPLITKAAQKKQVTIIDLHTATSNMEANFPDKIHPNPDGAAVIAETVYKAITGKEKQHKAQAFPGRQTTWKGFDRYDFRYKNRETIVVAPRKALIGNPWIWRPAFFGAFPSVDNALLEKGFHVVYYDLTHLYGSPNAVRLGNDFYQYITRTYHLSPKVTLEGFSRGGLFAFNWSAQNTDKVACIYVDAPVCNLLSWPGKQNEQQWSETLKEWNLTEKEMEHFKGNPTETVQAIAKARIPVIGVCGDSDKVVPYENNMKIVRNILAQSSSPVELILKQGVDHHPHSLENPKAVVDFIVRNQPEYQTPQRINTRGSLTNSYVKFERERTGRVAFLGGSITRMNGWRNAIMQQLTQRSPNTTFDFIDAGIPSTGSTPGAFRLKNDVLKNGEVDLLFVEAAVNDATNGFGSTEQVRGMEGVVRHALIANPNTDIVMLHFIYDPFIPMLKQGKIPDVILNHERVANHYLVPSINLAQEIVERMEAGEFSWEQFGGVHPAPLGHDCYAAAIARLFDSMWSNIDLNKTMIPHHLPTAPLDEYSYFNGKLLDIENAKLISGWKHVNSWNPTDNAEKREGFYNVSMLEAKQAGATLSLTFEGKAIGIFCVAGPATGIVEYSIDGAPFRKVDAFTQWSKAIHLPWVCMFATELTPGKHKLILRVSKDKNSSSMGNELQIRDFLINAE